MNTPMVPRRSAIEFCAVVYELARERWRAIREGLSAPTDEYGDPRTLVPRYLRASEAEEQRARREREA